MDLPVRTEVVDGLRVARVLPAVDSDAAPVLFVHGLWGGSWVFEHWLQLAAARGREAWALDLRGRHGSGPLAALASVTFADYVHDVESVLDAIGPAAVVGHSMGGLLAQSVAWRPDVRAAVFVASVPPPGIPLASWALLRRAPRYAIALLRGRPFRPTAADMRELALNGLPAPRQAELATRFVEDSGHVARQLAFGEVPPPRRLHCPALVVGAAADRLTPAAVQRRIAARYGADYVEVAGGHMLPVEPGWRTPLGRALSWLDAHAARRRSARADGLSRPGIFTQP
jgi:pimeloyl-ACP methyl ester carboxylesterase